MYYTDVRLHRLELLQTCFPVRGFFPFSVEITTRNFLEKAEAALLLLVAAALTVALAARLALLAAAAAVLLAGLAVLLARAARSTTFGHLYLLQRFLLRGGAGPKVDERTPGSRPSTMSQTQTILLLDTETNGLPKNRFAPVSEFTVWPAILQLSWAVYRVSPDGTMVQESSRDVGLSLAPEIPWDAGAAKIHGLSEVEGRHGSPVDATLSELAADLRRVDCVVVHNLAFDKPVIRAAGYAEASRSEANAHLRNLWPSKLKEYCTMRETTDIICIPPTAKQAAYNISKHKSPRLNELYQWLFGASYDVSGSALHSAKGDVHCLAECVGELLRRNLISFPLASNSQ